MRTAWKSTANKVHRPNERLNMQKVAAQTRPWCLWNGVCWIAEQQECLGGSLQQIMSITHCVENPSPLFSFTPQQKTNGPHSLLFGWGVNYRPRPIWRATSDNGACRGPPTTNQQSLPGLLGWYHLLMPSYWHLKPDPRMKHNRKPSGTKGVPLPRPWVLHWGRLCKKTLEAITPAILKQTSAVTVLISV